MITPADAAEILTIAAAFDRRTVGEADALAWADALHDLDPHDCGQAVRDHYANSTDWLMPAHVRAGVKRLRAERMRAVPTSALEPADVDPDDIAEYQQARLRLVRAVADGKPVPADVAETLPTRRPVAELMRSTAARLPRIPRVSS